MRELRVGDEVEVFDGIVSGIPTGIYTVTALNDDRNEDYEVKNPRDGLRWWMSPHDKWGLIVSGLQVESMVVI